MGPLTGDSKISQASTSASSDNGKTLLFSGAELLVILLLFLSAVLVVEIDGFASPMIYDSASWIAGNSHVFAKRQPLAVAEIMPQRPLFMLSLYLNYVIHGMDPIYFRALNALILAGTGVALMVMLNMIMLLHPSGIVSAGGRERVIIFLVGLLFVVHPIQVFAVLYIWQRETLLACLFYFSALAAYAAGRAGAIRNPVTAYLLTTLFFFLGLASKENLITLPVAIMVLEFVFFEESLKKRAKRAVAIGIIASVPFLIYLYLAHHLHGPESVSLSVFQRLSQHFQESGISLLNVILTESRVWFLYLESLIVPSPGELQLVRAMEVSTSLFDPPITVLACFGIGGLVAVGFALRKREPLVSFGLWFFCVALLPESLLLPQYLFCGYRAILPMAGLMLILARMLIWVSTMLRSKLSASGINVALVVAMLIAVSYLGITTRSISARWGPHWFWEHAFAALPQCSSRAENTPYLDVTSNYGIELTRSGDLQGAIEVLQQAAEIPTAAEHHKKAQGLYNLGYALMMSGNSQEATERFNQASQASPRYARPYIGLGTLSLWAGEVPAAIEHFTTAVRVDPSLPESHFSLGKALLLTGHSERAAASLQKALELKPNYAEASANLGKALLNLDRREEAIDHLKKAVAARPDHAEFHSLLATAYGKLGRVHEAEQHLKRALEIQQDQKEAKPDSRLFAPTHSE